MKDRDATAVRNTRTYSRKPTLLLHVGPGKTGSSAIQAWLANKAEVLTGFLYPTAKEPRRFTGNGADLAALLMSGPLRAAANKRRERLQNMLALYASLAAEKRCHTVILSSEHLPHCTKENLDFFRQCIDTYFKPRVVGFVRDPYWVAWSLWGQEVKRKGISEDFGTYALRNACVIGEKLSQFIKPFEDVRLLTYRDGNAVKDFAHAVGITSEIPTGRPEDDINRSLDRDELELLLAINRIFKSALLSTQISDQMLLKRPQSRPYRYFDPVLASAVREANAPILADLKNLIINPEVPIIDDRDDSTDKALNTQPRNLDPETLGLVLASIKAWHDESSPIRLLQKLVKKPPPEANYKRVLPEGFNSIEYLLLNSDVLLAGADPMVHYFSYGRDEGRKFCRPGARSAKSPWWKWCTWFGQRVRLAGTLVIRDFRAPAPAAQPGSDSQRTLRRLTT
jgi:hypothetical protein